MFKNHVLEELSRTRNIQAELDRHAGLKAEEDSDLAWDKPLAESLSRTMDFAEYMAEPGLEERVKEAECIIRQLKDYYRARGLDVYEREGENSLLLHDRKSICLVQTRADAEFCMIALKVLLPVIVPPEHMAYISRTLHSFNEDPEVGFGFFHLEDTSGQVSCIYRWSFAGGDFTEEGFHRYYRSAVKAAENYRRTIQQLLK